MGANFKLFKGSEIGHFLELLTNVVASNNLLQTARGMQQMRQKPRQPEPLPSRANPLAKLAATPLPKPNKQIPLAKLAATPLPKTKTRRSRMTSLQLHEIRDQDHDQAARGEAVMQ